MTMVPNHSTSRLFYHASSQKTPALQVGMNDESFSGGLGTGVPFASLSFQFLAHLLE